VQLRRVALPLDRVIAQTIDRVADRARRAGVEIRTEIPAGMEALADPVAFDAALRNVLENAIASTAPLGRGAIRIKARSEGGRIALDVSDSGVGIDPAEAPLLFQKFAYTDEAHRSGGRTGLGLYISRRLMELGGGSISAHSEGLGHGARFTLTWPGVTEQQS
jgi:signal transduction histidine kinase